MKKQSLATAITAAVFLLSLNFVFKNSNAVAAQHSRQIPVVVENFQTGQAEILYRDLQPDEMRGLAITSKTPTGVIRLAIILTNFTDNPSQPFIQAQVRQMAFDSNYPNSLASRIIANSYSIAGIAGEVFDWITVDPLKNSQGQPYTGCNKSLLARDAAIQAAGAQGFNYYMLIFPSRFPGCDADGFGDILGTNSGLFGN